MATGINDNMDDRSVSDIVLSSDEDDICVIACMSPNTKTKKDLSVERENIGKERNIHGYDSCDTSALNASLSCMDIDLQKHEKKKTKSFRKNHRSDSSSSSSRHSSSSRNCRPRKRSTYSHSPIYIDLEKNEKKKTKPSRKNYRSDSSSSSSRHRSSSRNCRPRKRSTYSHSPVDINREKHEQKTRMSQRKSYSSSSSLRHCSPIRISRSRNKSTNSQVPLRHYQREARMQTQRKAAPYYCEVCEVDLNSVSSYNSHVNGKKHSTVLEIQKMNKIRHMIEVPCIRVSASANYMERSKYPKPVDGVTRRKVNRPAKIQHIIEEKVKRPCIGLDFVTEIQGIASIQYYCSICNAICFSQSIIPHLTGHNHMRQSARKFYPNYKEIISDIAKPARENKILEMLKELQDIHGMGKMAVEVEDLDSVRPYLDSFNFNKNQTHEAQISKPSTSKGTGSDSSDISFSELYERASIPSKVGNDFFCHVCQAHMSSDEMWDSHINGKRHLINLTKFPGDVPSKTRTVPVPDRQANFVGLIKHYVSSNFPIVGLDHIRETEFPKLKIFTYKCFLCGDCITQMYIFEHIVSLKHRLKYLEHIKFPGREIARGMTTVLADPLVDEMCHQAEVKYGRGNPQVHVLKSLLFA